jgi:MFS family permease
LTLTEKERHEPEQPSRYRWVVLFASFFAFVVFAFAFQSVPPILDTLENNFGVIGAEAGLLMSMVVIPGIALALPAGFIIDSYGFRFVGFLSIVSVAVGSLITALADTFAVALLGRFILGLGGAFLIVGTPTIIPQWFRRKEMGKAMGIYGTNMPVAIIIAFPTAAVLTQSFGWRSPFYASTVVAVVCALVFAATTKEGPLKGESKPIQVQEIKQATKTAEVWKASIIWLFFEITTIAFLTWAPTLFQRFKSLDSFYASLLASVVMYSALFFVPLFGWASDRFGRRKPFIIVGSFSMALSLISISYASSFFLPLSVEALGISAAMTPPLVMAIVAQSLPPRLSGTGFGIVTLCQNIGIAVSAPLAGYLLQATQSLVLTFFGISVFVLASAATALTMKSK